MRCLYPYVLFLVLVVTGLSCQSGCQQKTTSPASGEELPGTGEVRLQADDKTGTVDLTPRPLEHIAVGTVIGNGPPEGWSHLVLFVIPTLAPEDENDLQGTNKATALYYARLLNLTILANVTRSRDPAKQFCLEKVAAGFATDVKGESTIITGKETLGAKLGMFGPRILRENEKIMDQDVRQVVRTETMLMFDARSIMLRDGEHQSMIMRHAILVDPATGHLYTLVWLLTDDYQPAEDTLQLLPNGMREKRLLSIKRDRFNILGIPREDAFALRQVPQGTPVPYTPKLKEAATAKTFTEASVPVIEDTLRAAAVKAAGK